MCGEDRRRPSGPVGVAGSPPHARGRPGAVAGDFPVGGITPACAGKTRDHWLCAYKGPDHPRMRGEDTSPKPRSKQQLGSPPHARGRPSAPNSKLGNPRITPACAGKTGAKAFRRQAASDHPRMRGEDALSDQFVVFGPGSPPHARGRPTGMVHGRGEARITPACAGKTDTTGFPVLSTEDHPRMRGEDTHGSSGVPEPPGSPPHARGRPRRSVAKTVRGGITPACAGKTVHSADAAPILSDHPRMRGEDLKNAITAEAKAGSPPHARGRLFVNARDPVDKRITPACAGKTSR